MEKISSGKGKKRKEKKTYKSHMIKRIKFVTYILPHLKKTPSTIFKNCIRFKRLCQIALQVSKCLLSKVSKCLLWRGLDNILGTEAEMQTTLWTATLLYSTRVIYRPGFPPRLWFPPMSGLLLNALAQCPEHACLLCGLKECSSNVSDLSCWQRLLTIWNQKEAFHDASEGAKTDLIDGGKFRELNEKPFHLPKGKSTSKAVTFSASQDCRPTSRNSPYHKILYLFRLSEEVKKHFCQGWELLWKE